MSSPKRPAKTLSSKKRSVLGLYSPPIMRPTIPKGQLNDIIYPVVDALATTTLSAGAAQRNEES